MQPSPNMLYRSSLRIAVFALLALAGACRSLTDLGTPCVLVKKNPDGGTVPVALKERDLPDGGKDFISFGAAACENLVCVRDSSFPKNPDPNADAVGYCSSACAANSGSCPAANSADDSNPSKRLTCLALLLDEQTLAAICSNDPAKCYQYFGGTTSPYFCARGTGM